MPAGFPPAQPRPQPQHFPPPGGGGAPPAAGWRVGLTVFTEPPQEGLCLLAVLVYPCSGNLGFTGFISCTVSPLATFQSLRSLVITNRGWSYKFSPFMGHIFETGSFLGELLTVDSHR